VLWKDCCSFGDDRPLALLNIVAVHVDVVSISIQASVKDEGSVHERARVDKTSMFAHAHLLHVEDIASIENLEHDGAFSAEDHDFLVCNLVSKAHVRGHPVALINHRSLNFLPDISLDIIAFDGIYNALLVNSASKRKHVIVFKGAKRYSSSRDAHLSNNFPLILLTVILLTIAEDLVVDKCADNVKEALDGADRMISMGVVHACDLEQRSKQFVISVATLKVHVHCFEISSSQVNSTCLDRNRARVKWNFMLHSHGSSLKLTCFHFVNLGASLVPLKRVKPLNPGRAKAVFGVKVNSQI